VIATASNTVTATPRGNLPTGIVAVTVLLAVAITDNR